MRKIVLAFVRWWVEFSSPTCEEPKLDDPAYSGAKRLQLPREILLGYSSFSTGFRHGHGPDPREIESQMLGSLPVTFKHELIMDRQYGPTIQSEMRLDITDMNVSRRRIEALYLDVAGTSRNLTLAGTSQ